MTAAGHYLNSVAAPPPALIQTGDWVVSFAVITVLFAFIFKILPNVSLKWGDVTIGAVLTSLLFTAGKSLLGVYLGILLVWVYYSAQVFYLSAEFTRVYACRRDSMFTALSAVASN
jgi:membrane protein